MNVQKIVFIYEELIHYNNRVVYRFTFETKAHKIEGFEKKSQKREERSVPVRYHLYFFN